MVYGAQERGVISGSVTTPELGACGPQRKTRVVGDKGEDGANQKA